MKLIHLSDLHLGKRVNEISMLEDQRYILTKVISIIDEEQPDCVVIAGDVYDKSVAPGEAIQLFDDFICRLAKRNLSVFVITGNHDSPERMSFGSRLMDKSGIHISPVYDGTSRMISMQDQYGTVDIYMLPFIKPAHIRGYFPDEQIESYTDAMRVAIAQMNLNKKNRNVLITHQFVTGATRSESEDISVGGSDNVDVTVFEDFDYVALGHIHRSQNIGTERVRYCGTPLKYSFSEISHEKSITVVEIQEKSEVSVRTVPLIPKHDMRELKGTYMELTAKSYYENIATDDYMRIILTDEECIPDAIGKLRLIYPNLMKLEYDNKRTRNNAQIDRAEGVEHKTPLQLFVEFYEKQNNQPMSEEQLAFSKKLIETIQEEQA